MALLWNNGDNRSFVRLLIDFYSINHILTYEQAYSICGYN